MKVRFLERGVFISETNQEQFFPFMLCSIIPFPVHQIHGGAALGGSLVALQVVLPLCSQPDFYQESCRNNMKRWIIQIITQTFNTRLQGFCPSDAGNVWEFSRRQMCRHEKSAEVGKVEIWHWVKSANGLNWNWSKLQCRNKLLKLVVLGCAQWSRLPHPLESKSWFVVDVQ